MSSTKFFINGKPVPKDRALRHWLASETYQRAHRKTRNTIFKTALLGDEHGNHNPHGEVEHLAEAGITFL